jgi:hypothetical protein
MGKTDKLVGDSKKGPKSKTLVPECVIADNVSTACRLPVSSMQSLPTYANSSLVIDLPQDATRAYEEHYAPVNRQFAAWGHQGSSGGYRASQKLLHQGDGGLVAPHSDVDVTPHPVPPPQGVSSQAPPDYASPSVFGYARPSAFPNIGGMTGEPVTGWQGLHLTLGRVRCPSTFLLLLVHCSTAWIEWKNGSSSIKVSF